MDRIALYGRVGNLEYGAQRFASAEHLYRRADELAPGIWDIQESVAAAASRVTGEDYHALLLRELEQAAGIYPQLRRYFAQGQAALAFQERSAEQFEEAARHLQWAIGLDERTLEYRLALAQCYLQAGRSDAANDVIRQAEEDFAGDPKALARIAAWREGLGKGSSGDGPRTPDS
jgi:tetratricopeptide (TPR) repeat protein